MRTEKGNWILNDNGKEINYGSDCGTAWARVFLLKSILYLPKIPNILFPVRSLVPNMKKRRELVKGKKAKKTETNKPQRGVRKVKGEKNENTCVVCGETIPEGRQICKNCEEKGK